MNDCTILIYTHSEYDDILEITLKRMKKYANTIPLYICTNNKGLIEDKYVSTYNITHVYEYNDSMVYHDKLASAIINIETSYILLYHDNNCLYDHLDISIMNRTIEQIRDLDIQVLRLSSAGINNPTILDSPRLIHNTGPYYFSVWPAIWNKSALLNICIRFKKPYRLCEDEECQMYTRALKGYYISKHANDLYDNTSHIFPSVHYVQYGKWMFYTYKKLVDDIINEYNMYTSVRST